MRIDFGGKNRIFVTGIGEKTGATTTAIMLSKYLADNGEKVAYIQLTGGLAPYYYLAMDREDGWKSSYNSATIRNICNLIEKVNWAVRLPSDAGTNFENNSANDCKEENDCITCREKILINQMPAKTLVIDSEKYLEEADMILALIDPLPSKILQNIEKIKALKKMEYEGYNVVWIVNKMNKGVNLSHIKKSLKLGAVYTMDFLDAAEIYSNEYAGVGILKSKQMYENFKGSLEKIFR